MEAKLSFIKIKDLGETVTGKTPSSKFPEDFGNKYLFVTPSDNFDEKNMKIADRWLSEDGFNKLKNKALPIKSIMVTCIGSAMGKVAMNGGVAITNQQINSIIPDSSFFDADYIYYVLKNSYKILRNAASGSTALPILNKSDFDLLELAVFKDLHYQKSIAKVLSDLDAKIEVNNRINEELESLAKTIYDYWFVQFDFPDGEGKPYKSAGGKMVYNEEVKREIPEGWEVKKLSDFVNCYDSLRKPLSKQQREDFVGDIPYYGATGIMGFVKEFLFEKDLILLAEDGSVMDENGFPILQYIYGKSWVNNHAHVLEPKNLRSYDFLRLHLSKIHVIKIMTGSIQKKITQENLMKKVFFFPPEEILASFDKKLKPIRQKIKNIEFQNQELSALRDWLLPMLMNGQVGVREITN